MFGNADPVRVQAISAKQVKEQTVRASYATIFVGRFMKGSGVFCFAHLAFILILFALLFLRHAFSSDMNWKHLELPTLYSFPYFVTNLLRNLVFVFVSNISSKWVIGICFLGVAQYLVLSFFVQDTTKLAANNIDWILHICACSVPPALLGILLTGTINGYLAYCYMNLVGMPPLPEEEKQEDSKCSSLFGPSSDCWDTQYLLVIWISVFWACVSFYLQYYRRGFVLKYPTVGLSAKEHIWNELLGTLNDSFERVIGYCILTYVICLIPSSIIFTEALLMRGGEKSFGLFFNFPFLWNLLVWPSVTHMSFNLCWALMEIAQTERLDLSIESKYHASSNVITLSDAMQHGCGHMKYLAFFEFHKIACEPKNPAAIHQFFILSIPGSHPRNWSNVLDAVLNEAAQFAKKIRDFNAWQKSLSRKLPIINPTSSRFSASLYQHYSKNHDQARPLRRRTIAQTQMRQLINSPSAQELIVEPSEPETTTQRFIHLMSPPALKAAFKKSLKQTFDSKVQPYIDRTKAVYDANDPVLVLTNYLTDTQPLEWGLKGIVEIVCHSLDFDSHGIVQRDMERIVICLTDLHQTLESINCNLSFSWGPTVVETKARRAFQLLRQLDSSMIYYISKIHMKFSNQYEYLRIPELQQQQIFKMTNSPNTQTFQRVYY